MGTKIGNLSPAQIIRCVSRCFELIRPDLEVPPYDENVSMSGRYKVASHISQAITVLEYVTIDNVASITELTAYLKKDLVF